MSVPYQAIIIGTGHAGLDQVPYLTNSSMMHLNALPKHPIICGRKLYQPGRPMTKVEHAVEKGETLGFMKVLINADTQRIMGAAILGTGGDEAIHSILDVMYADKPYTVIQRAMHIHPTVSELIPTMVGELQPLS
jgi:hypothetical protein